jgi:hypothetical protein
MSKHEEYFLLLFYREINKIYEALKTKQKHKEKSKEKVLKLVIHRIKVKG